jgi:hypothetical protein
MCSFASNIIFLLMDVFTFVLKTVVLLSNVFASLGKNFLFFFMCSLRFEHNFLLSM